MTRSRLIRPAYRKKINAAMYAKMMSHLLIGASVADLVEETGLGVHTVRKYVNALWNHQVIGVCAWEPTTAGRRTVRVYQIGLKDDVPQPKFTRRERTARGAEKRRRMKERLLQQTWAQAA